MSRIIRLLNRIGITRTRDDGTTRWPVHVDPWRMWTFYFRTVGETYSGGWFCLFRNKPGVIKWVPGRLLPRRWGFRVLGLEIGDRG